MMNPWIGLSSYTEDSIKDYQFNGRSTAISTLAELIRQNLFVTLYGRSGIGKTSLLQAGVFPVLREYGMYPVSVRLNDIKNDRESASEVMWSRICEVLSKQACKYKEDEIDPCVPNFSDVLVLRNLFSSGHFVDENGLTVIPVIVLDQFEEFLYNYPNASKIFVSQLYALIDDNVNLKVPHPTWHDETDFRIVVSIREDDLFLFEDLIDRLNCEDFKSNRYRLMPLSDVDAKEIILKPSKDKDFFDEEKKDIIADEIIRICKTNGNSINTLMLSLTCYVLYNKYIAKNQIISLNSLYGYKDVLESYYLEAVKNLPKSQRFYIEDSLVDNQGRRTSIYLTDLEKRAPKAKGLIEDSNSRLLTVNQGRVELIHDQLAASVAKIKTNRRSRKTKQIGVFALIVGLIILFVYSFSQPYTFNENKIAAIETSKNYVAIQNSTSLREYVIENDDDYDGSVCYIISSCPNLRCVKVEKKYASIRILNCPRLTIIETPKKFHGLIDIYNCPNTIVNDKINVVRDWIDFRFSLAEDKNEDSLKFYEFTSEYEFGRELNYIYYYDAVNNKISYLANPYYLNDSVSYKGSSKYFNGIFGVGTGLPDSLKIQTDLYVPFGRIDEFKQLNEFLPFKSINETPFYSLWGLRLKGMLKYFDSNLLLAYVSIIGLFMLQFLFWIIGFYNYRNKYNNFYVRLFIAFAYGIGMSLVGLLSFMAVYWFIYLVLFPYNQIVSIIAGVLAGLISLLIIYKNAFYSLFLYFKENGIRFIVRDICKKGINFYKIFIIFIRFHIRIVILCVGVTICVLIGFYLYVIGKNKRVEYISQLQLITNYSKLPQIIDMLETQHASRLYGFFSDSLQVYKEKLKNDSIMLVCKITPDHLSRLAKENNIELNFSDLDWRGNAISVSSDGTKQCIRVGDKKSDKEYLLYYDMNIELVDTIIGFDESSHVINSSFSPSAGNIILSIDDKIYNYSTKYKKNIALPFKLEYEVADIKMKDDETFFVISGNTLYEGSNKGDTTLKKLNNENFIWNDNLVILGDSHIAANSINYNKACIYDIDKNSLSILSTNEHIGSLITAISSDKLVTSKGFFNLKNNEFIPFMDSFAKKYVVGNNIFSITGGSWEGDSYVIKNAESGEIVNNIFKNKDDEYSSLLITNNGELLLTNNTKAIFIYSLHPEHKKVWPITNREMRIFDLK